MKTSNWLLDLLQKKSILSTIPIDLSKVEESEVDKEILRIGVLAELDAVNLYEQMAALAKDVKIKNTLLDIIKEEKTHIGEFQALLLERDKEQENELEEGKKEVEKISKGD